MMDSVTKSSLVKALQKEFIRRNLIKFFEDKGYDNFLVKPYPPTLQDIVERVPVLDGTVEVKHFLEDVNMQSGIIKMGWNMFVLGSNRIFLGYTNHRNMTDVENSVNDAGKYHDGPITVKGVVESIVEFLGKSNKIRDAYEQAKMGSGGDMTKLPGYQKPYKQIPDIRRRV